MKNILELMKLQESSWYNFLTITTQWTKKASQIQVYVHVISKCKKEKDDNPSRPLKEIVEEIVRIVLIDEEQKQKQHEQEQQQQLTAKKIATTPAANSNINTNTNTSESDSEAPAFPPAAPSSAANANNNANNSVNTEKKWPKHVASLVQKMKKLKLVQNGNEVSSLFPHPQALTTDSLKEARYLVTTAFKKLSPHFPQSLTLCEGCRVMLTSNLDTSKGLVNGCLGTVTAIKPSPESPTKIDEIRVLFDKHEQPEIVPYLASEAVIYNGLLKVSRSQFPLVLAGAFTIHKSQGLTIPFLHVNLKGVFEAGQAYVAVSRGVSLNQMIVKGAQPSCFWASPEAIAFDDILALTAKYPPNCNSTDEKSYQECLQKIKEELKNNTEQNIRRKAKQKSEKVESPPDHTIPFNTTKDFTKNLTGQHIHSRPKSKSLLQEHRDEFHRSRISQESDDDYDFNDNFLEQDNNNDNVQDDQLLSEDEEHSSSSFSSSKSSRSSNSTSNNNR